VLHVLHPLVGQSGGNGGDRERASFVGLACGQHWPLCIAEAHLLAPTHFSRLERNAEGGLDLHIYNNAEQAGGIIKCSQVGNTVD